MDIEIINIQLEWRDIKIVPQYKAEGSKPFIGQVLFGSPEIARGTLEEQFKSACISSAITKSFLFVTHKVMDDRLIGLFVPSEWIDQRRNSWSTFSHYLSFLLKPMEPETQPTDSMSESYHVLQQNNTLMKGEQNARIIYDSLTELSQLVHQTPLVQEDKNVKQVDDLMRIDAFDEMMRYCVKTLPEYSGSEMEELGEPLWNEWRTLTKELVG